MIIEFFCKCLRKTWKFVFVIFYNCMKNWIKVWAPKLPLGSLIGVALSESKFLISANFQKTVFENQSLKIGPPFFIFEKCSIIHVSSFLLLLLLLLIFHVRKFPIFDFACLKAFQWFMFYCSFSKTFCIFQFSFLKPFFIFNFSECLTIFRKSRQYVERAPNISNVQLIFRTSSQYFEGPANIIEKWPKIFSDFFWKIMKYIQCGKLDQTKLFFIWSSISDYQKTI